MTTLNDFNKVDGVTSVMAAHVNDLIASTMRSEYSNVETLSGTRTLLDLDTPIQRFDCNGSNRIVLCPTANTEDNHPFLLVNASDGGETITVKDNAGSVTLATVAEGDMAFILPDGDGTYKVVGNVFAITAGSGISVDSTDPANPIVSAGVNQGFMTNGKIVPSVASNNLTLALKTLAGTDPSPSDKVQIRIGDVVHEVTSALSVTKNAGTNWCNAGSAELATKEIDYFAYIGYNATDGVTIGFARIPEAAIYSDFSTTSTNENYCAISTITNAAAGDNYVNVGRFAATLSAGAGYTWTVPTYTRKNLIQSPIFKTRWLSYTPTRTGYSANPTNSVYEYYTDENVLKIMFSENTAGTSNATTKTYTAPFTSLSTSNYQYNPALPGPTDNGATVAAGFVYIGNNTNIMSFHKSTNAAWTASGGCLMGRFMIEFRRK